MSAHGELARVGVEGTGSYGAGLARYLAGCGIEVTEVIRPNRQARRQRGKSDTAGAVAAACGRVDGPAGVMWFSLTRGCCTAPRRTPAPTRGRC
jgi:transposase